MEQEVNCRYVRNKTSRVGILIQPLMKLVPKRYRAMFLYFVKTPQLNNKYCIIL